MSFPATAHGAPGQAVAGGVTYTYTYNGPSKSNAQRVKKAAASASSYDKLYWYGLADNGGSQVLAESALDGTLTSEYIFMGDCVQPCARLPLVAARNPMERIARRDVASGGGGGNVYYFLGDRLGNARIVTNSTGGIVEESDFLPYGTERTITDSLDNNYKFTGHERDAETTLDHTLYRQHSSTIGRWLSADPIRGRVANPQSWNLYAYVENSPCNRVDFDGRLMEEPGPAPDGGGGGGGAGGLFDWLVDLFTGGGGQSNPQLPPITCASYLEQATGGAFRLPTSAVDIALTSMLLGENSHGQVGTRQYRDGDKLGNPTGNRITWETIDRENSLMLDVVANLANAGRGSLLSIATNPDIIEGALSGAARFAAYQLSLPGSPACRALEGAVRAVNDFAAGGYRPRTSYNQWRAVVQKDKKTKKDYLRNGGRVRTGDLRVGGTDFFTVPNP